jgi:hypothetical protein
MAKKTKSKFFLRFSLLLIIPLLGYYLFQMGDTVRSNYLMKKNQLEIDNLKEENLSLQAQAAKEFSLAELESKMKAMDFVPMEKAKYLSLQEGLTVSGGLSYNK